MAKQQKSQIAKDILRRVRWLYFVFLFVAIAIFGRVVWIQYGPEGADLRAKARKITFEWVSISAERGDVLARDGRILATSIPMYEIRMDFAARGLVDSVFNKHVDSLAYCLSNFFKDKSTAGYKKMLTDARNKKESNRYKLISPRRINYIEEKEVSKFPIFRLGKNRGGYIKEMISKRLLPHGSLAQRTIGMTNQSGVKLGVEGAFDDQLKGTDGTSLMQRISGSFKVPVPDAMNVEPTNGMDVVTTLDVDLQDVAETALKKQLEEKGADWGTVMLMEVATGEIHAMANISRKNPGVFVEDFNYAIGRRIEPGSTFKLATLITLLDDANMSLDDMINCENGVAVIGPRRVVDDHREGVISLRRVFEVSSNIGFAKAVYEHYGKNPARFVEFIQKMGMGKPLGIDIPGEQSPLIKHPDDKKIWDKTTLVMMAYGYALEITPMHTLALFNAIANGGRMMRPHLVKEVQSYGQTVRTFGSEVINPAICSPKTVDLVKECLEGVVSDGTARLILKNPYYEVAAKTGTAQMAFNNGGYTDSKGGRNYLATMVGYFPADNPKYTCIVAIKTYYGPGNRNTYYGASLSGPVFRAVADRVYAANPSWHETVGVGDEKIVMSANDIKNGQWPATKRVMGKLSLPVKTEGDIGEWARITQSEGNVAAGNTAGADSEGGKPKELTAGTISMEENMVPDVTGMGLKDAIYLLESKGLTVAFSGKGAVKKQSVSAGTPVKKGEVVHITMGL